MAVIVAAIAIGAAVASVAVSLFVKVPKFPKTEQPELNATQTVQRHIDLGLKRRVLFGTRTIGGVGVYDNSRGTDLEYGDRITVYTSWPVSGFQQLFLNGEPVTLSGDPTTGWVAVTSHFRGKPGAVIKGPVTGIAGDPPRAFFRLWKGDNNTSLGAELAAAYPAQFNATDCLHGCCVGWLICVNTDDDIGGENDPEDLQGKNFIPFRGFPRKRAKLNGSAICDPRNGGDYDDPSTWTSDPAVFANSGLVDGMFQHGFWGGPNQDRLIAGLGYAGDLSDIKDIEQIKSNADYCLLNGFECHGLVTSGSARDGKRIRDTFNGILSEGLAKVRTIPEGARPHYGTVDFSQLPDAARVVHFNEDGYATEVRNKTRTTYAEKNENYMDKDLPSLSNPAWITRDGGESEPLVIQLPFVDNALQAAKIEKADLFITRLTMKARIKDLPLKPFEDYFPGGTVTIINSDIPRLNGRTVQIQSAQETATGQISWEVREYSALAHEWGQDDVPDTTVNLPGSRPPDYPPTPVADPVTRRRAIISDIRASNPEGLSITASGAGSNVSITLSAHSRVYVDRAVSVEAFIINGQQEGRRLHFYYDDETRADDSPTIFATMSRADASNSADHPGRHYVGQILAEEGATGLPGNAPTVVPERVPTSDTSTNTQNVGSRTADQLLLDVDNASDVAQQAVDGVVVTQQAVATEIQARESAIAEIDQKYDLAFGQGLPRTPDPYCQDVNSFVGVVRSGSGGITIRERSFAARGTTLVVSGDTSFRTGWGPIDQTVKQAIFIQWFQNLQVSGQDRTLARLFYADAAAQVLGNSTELYDDIVGSNPESVVLEFGPGTPHPIPPGTTQVLVEVFGNFEGANGGELELEWIYVAERVDVTRTAERFDGVEIKAQTNSEEIIRLDDDKVEVTIFNQLTAQVDDPNTGLTSRASQTEVDQVQTALNGKAEASALSQLTAQVDDPNTGLTSRASQTEVDQVQADLSGKASAASVDQLVAEVDGIPSALTQGPPLTSNPFCEGTDGFVLIVRSGTGSLASPSRIWAIGGSTLSVSGDCNVRTSMAQIDPALSYSIHLSWFQNLRASGQDRTLVRLFFFDSSQAFISASIDLFDGTVSGSPEKERLDFGPDSTVTIPPNAAYAMVDLFANFQGANSGQLEFDWFYIAERVDPALALARMSGLEDESASLRSDLTILETVSADVEGFTEGHYGVNLQSLGGGLFALAGFAIRTAVGAVQTVSDFLIYADRIALSAGSTLFEIVSGRARLNSPLELSGDNSYIESLEGGVRFLAGARIGASNDLVLWWGPDTVTEATATAQNGYMAFPVGATAPVINGDSYTPALYQYSTVSAATGTASETLTAPTAYSSKGGDLVASMVFRRESSRTYVESGNTTGTSTVQTKGSVLLTLQSNTNGAGWIDRGTKTVTGTLYRAHTHTPGSPPDPGTTAVGEQLIIDARLSIMASATAGQSVQWRAVRATLTDLPASHSLTDQTHTITFQENSA